MVLMVNVMSILNSERISGICTLFDFLTGTCYSESGFLCPHIKMC